MPFNKYGEASEIKVENTESCIPNVAPEQLEHWRKYAANLKMVAPKADDFLYFSAVMMHAAEAATLNDDGTPKLTVKGEPVQVGWDKSGNTWKWVSNDPNIKPYKNSNGDIFPEEELVKAHKKWVHKPLCVDHKSSSVEHTRGFIVDTYYDRALKRVVALCALDKANYPALARQVSTRVSNCVSMGTAVGRAICTDCGRVARAEQDFCKHMQSKSCYGEINVDLSPIELSIVMNGADNKATIKHIIAAANTMNTYLENKQKELSKLADNYQASITFTNGDPNQFDPEGKGKITNVNVTSKDLDSFKSDVAKAIEDFGKLQSSLSNNEENMPGSGNETVSNQSSGSIAMDEGAPTDSGLSLQTPQTARFASVERTEPLAELHKLTQSIEVRLSQIKEALSKLEQQSTNTEEEHMSGSNLKEKNAYFQGAGGVNEPTPGQVKYPKDPLNEELREKEDKHMTGQPPFPEVGPVDGMHPSPASADPSDELQRKKMLARAQAEESRLRREAIVNLAKQALKDKQAEVNKEGYMQGGGGVNEPTPGKPKYPKDPLNEELRESEDKQMVGQPPFPGVGPVDGLHPSPSSADPKDELKRKQMLARASLRGRFVYAHNEDGSSNKANSAWEVYLGDKLLLTASVNELAPGRVNELYDGIATKEFGAKLIEKIKTNGAAAVSKMIKQGQDMPPAAPAGGDMGAPPADMGAPAPTAEPSSAPPAEDTGKAGDPKATAMELAEKVRDIGSDLVEAVRALTGEQTEMGMEGGPAGGPAMADDNSDSSAKSSSASLNTLRKEINSALIENMKEAVAELQGHQEELDAVIKIYDRGVPSANQEFVNSVVEDSLIEAKATVADAFKLMTAFVKYANGTRALVKRAEMEKELTALGADSEGDDMSDKKDNHSADGGDLMDLINDTNADLDLLAEDNNDHVGEEPHDEAMEHLMAGDANDTVQVKTPAEAAEVTKTNPQASVKVQASFDSRQGRAALRAKLAADALGKEDDGEVQDMTKAKFSDMLDQADRLADGQTHLDVKPSDDLGLVETLPEQNKAMMEVAKAPPKVRKEAEAIQRMIVAGDLDPADVDALVAEGLDKDAVAYWKKYFGQVEGGGEFANELVKEHVKAQLEAELGKYRVKLARSYSLAYDMAERSLCNADKGSIELQVDEIMKFDDNSFESLKKVVARHPLTGLHKAAGRLPYVGELNASGGENSAGVEEENPYNQLGAMLGTRKGSF